MKVTHWMMALVMALASAALAAPMDEGKLIETIKTGTTQEKAMACKQLTIWGSPKAVAALAPLLLDKELSSWTRIALENLPGTEADDALRDALNKTEGRLLIGVINSIGYRKDPKAVAAVASKISEADAEVTGAATATLGKIGGEEAAKILEQGLAGGSAAVRAACAEGAVLCAESFIKAGGADRAVKLYDAVRKADVPKPRIIEATRGAILARGNAGIALMVENIRSSDKGMMYVGLRSARELSDPGVQPALVAELAKADPARQILIIYVLADRGEAASLPVVLNSAKTGAPTVRVASLIALEKLGNASCVGALLDAAVDADEKVSAAAKTTLARLYGKDIEAELLARFQQATGKTRQALIELAASRRIEGSFPLIIKCAQDTDAGVRAAAIATIGDMGDEKQVADLVGLMQKSADAAERTSIEKALMTLTGRSGAACVPHLLPLTKSPDAALRSVALKGLAGSGGTPALAAVTAALQDKDEAVADEAVRTLSTWPNRWPDDDSVTAPLMAIAKAPKKPNHKILALRGVLQFITGTRKLDDGKKIAQITELQPMLVRPEEKRLAVSALGGMASGAALNKLAEFAADPAVTEEACLAIVNMKNIAKMGKGQKQKALQTVIEKSKIDATRNKAQDLLKR